MSGSGGLSKAELGCLESHYNVLLNTESELTLVLEDDFELCEDFDNELNKCLNELPKDWNALWLGGRVVKKENYSKNIFSLKATTGTYGYLVRKKFIPKLLTALSKKNKLADWAMSSVFENVYRSKKNLVKHKAGFSEIKGVEVDYKDLR